jgi:hypothetical protein
MTKSKGIGRGGRRKGAGRPRFAKTGKTSYFSTRLKQKTRDLLEAEAKRQGESLSVVAEYLLQLGLEEIGQRRERPRPLRALFFLLEILSGHVRGPYSEDPNYTWRSNPYMSDAFRAATLEVLETLRPPGKSVPPPPVRLPPPPTAAELGLGRGARILFDEKDLTYTFLEDPHNFGRKLADGLLTTARTIESDQTRLEQMGMGRRISPEHMRQHYGIIDAAHDFGLDTSDPLWIRRMMREKPK